MFLLLTSRSFQLSHTGCHIFDLLGILHVYSLYIPRVPLIRDATLPLQKILCLMPLQFLNFVLSDSVVIKNQSQLHQISIISSLLRGASSMHCGITLSKGPHKLLQLIKLNTSQA